MMGKRRLRSGEQGLCFLFLHAVSQAPVLAYNTMDEETRRLNHGG